MPRLRKYASTTVPEIGCAMAKRRRADSGDPAGADDGRCLGSGSGSGLGRLRKPPGFIGDVVEIDKAAAPTDDVKEITVVAGRRVGPFAGRALARFPSFQPDE